ncbi:DUF6087 family protein [Streptomyces avicenniae]|uniref:DUF6087 family protein n=1 Tax=Streptomyces avicenniae TaxID=500153 RepID=UPI000DA5EDDC|nr:DUF6087 family protein [Streptomyces avicenniae]
MGRHRRPGPPNQPSRAVPVHNPADPLGPYERRRRPPGDTWRRQRPLLGGAGHLRPTESRVLEEWDGFAYVVVGVAPDLAVATRWVHGDHPDW